MSTDDDDFSDDNDDDDDGDDDYSGNDDNDKQGLHTLSRATPGCQVRLMSTGGDDGFVDKLIIVMMITACSDDGDGHIDLSKTHG